MSRKDAKNSEDKEADGTVENREGFIARWLPRRVDSVVLALCVISVVHCYSPWLSLLNNYASSAVLAAVCVGITATYLSLIGTWILFSDRSLWQRFGVALLLSGIPAICLAMNFDWMRQIWGHRPRQSMADLFLMLSDEKYQTCTLLFCTQRWLVLSCIALVSVAIQSMTGWRISTRNASSGIPKHGSRIRDILLLTACVAIGVALFQALLGPDNAKAYGTWQNSWQSALAAGIAEFVLTSVLFLVPILVAFTSRFLRRHFAAYMAAVLLVFGSSATVFLVWENRETDPGRIGGIAGGTFVVTACLGVLFLWRRSGFHWTHVRRLDEVVSNSPKSVASQRIRVGVGVAVALVIFSVLFRYSCDIAALALALDGLSKNTQVDNPWRVAIPFAKQTKTISRVLGETSNIDSTFSDWPRARWESNADGKSSMVRANAAYEVDHIGDPTPFFAAMHAGDCKEVSIVYTAVSQACLEALAKQNRIGELRLHSHDVHATGFDLLCRSTKIRSLVAAFDATAKHVASMTRIPNLESVRLERPIRITPAVLSELRRLPVVDLNVSYADEHVVDLRGLNKLTQITITKSTIHEKVIAQINDRLRVCESLRRIVIDDCELDYDAALCLKKLRVKQLALLPRNRDFSIEDLAPIGENEHLRSLRISSHKLDELKKAKFNVQAGRELLRMQSDYRSMGPATTALRQVLGGASRGNGTSMEDALRKVAHQVEENTEGEIEGVDLTWIDLSPSEAKQIGEIVSLRRIRFGSPREITRPKVEESVFRLLFMNRELHSVEIPASSIWDEVLTEIAKLRKLRRLQLPLYVGGAKVRCIAAVVVPFSLIRLPEAAWRYENELSDTRKLISAAVSKSKWAGDQSVAKVGASSIQSMQLTEKGIEKLASLPELEYLMLPGYLLNSRTMRTIESFKRLEELHALFSVVDRETLKKIANIRRLKSLSIGVEEKDVDAVGELFSVLPQLHTLQLFFYGDSFENAKFLEATREKLRARMPNAEVYVHAFPALQ